MMIPENKYTAVQEAIKKHTIKGFYDLFNYVTIEMLAEDMVEDIFRNNLIRYHYKYSNLLCGTIFRIAGALGVEAEEILELITWQRKENKKSHNRLQR